MNIRETSARGVRFGVVKWNSEVARAYLYILQNDLHKAPFGLLEDVYVNDVYRGSGIARELLKAVIVRAKAEQCYKLIATSRNDGTREAVHDWYQRAGFRNYGTEFRIDF